MSGAHTSAWRSRLRSRSPLIYRSTTWRLPSGLIGLSPRSGSQLGFCNGDPWRTTEESLDGCSDCQYDEQQLARKNPGDRELREEHVRVLGKKRVRRAEKALLHNRHQFARVAEETGCLAEQHQSHDHSQGEVRGLTDETPERPPPGAQDRQIDEVEHRMAPQRRVRHHDPGEERERQDRKRHEDEQPETNDWTEHGHLLNFWTWPQPIG